MEFWLSYNNGAEKLLLPVNPSSFKISDGQKNTVIDTIGLGEINKIGKSKLKELTIESFFPKEYAPYCKTNELLKPYDYIAVLLRWKALEVPIRLIITDTPINVAVAIENIEYGERAGHRDVYYTLTLKEFRFFQLKVSTINTSVQKIVPVVNDTAKARITKKAPNNIYTVQKGDTYWTIAKKLWGNGAKYKEVKLLMLYQDIDLTPGTKVKLS